MSSRACIRVDGEGKEHQEKVIVLLFLKRRASGKKGACLAFS